MLSDGGQEVRVLGSLLIIPSEIILLVQSTDVLYDHLSGSGRWHHPNLGGLYPQHPSQHGVYFTKKDNIIRAIFALALALKEKMEECTCGRKKWFESSREWV